MQSQDKKDQEEKGKKARPESYPKPTETDTQLQNQDEFTGLKPNETGNLQDSSIETQKDAPNQDVNFNPKPLL